MYFCSSASFLMYTSFSSGVMDGCCAGLPTPLVAGDAGSRGVGGAGDGTPCVRVWITTCNTFTHCVWCVCSTYVRNYPTCILESLNL